MKRENTRCRLYVRDTRLAWIRGKELFQPRVDFKSILCLLIRMERLISIRRLSILWFLQISSDFAYSRLHDSCKLAYDASFYKWYNALKIDLVLTGFFRSCFPTKMFCYCFIYNRKYMKQNLTWKCKHVIRVVYGRCVKCVGFNIQMTIREMYFIYKFLANRYESFDCYIYIWCKYDNLKFRE